MRQPSVGRKISLSARQKRAQRPWLKKQEKGAREQFQPRGLNLIRSGSSEFANRSAASDSRVIVDRNGGAPRAAISPQHIKLERVLLVNDILGFKRAATGQSNAKGCRTRS